MVKCVVPSKFASVVLFIGPERSTLSANRTIARIATELVCWWYAIERA